MDRRCYCRQHPSHKQSKGVCPFCLRERLSNITSSSSSSTTNLSNPSTTSLSPILSSELDYVFATNKEEDEREKEPLKKSRSLAFVMEEEEEKDKKKNNNKRRKFWSKFLVKRKDEGDDKELMHSKTMKDKYSSTKWVVFS
ncbi:uncharacterized protein A4U43_C03F18610 [Asparagus officinalis]|uniref:Uncharacterized protein n=1 Tax=Asparagus officinalis TaxID=4686 RepID=A0A5P1FG47_ASPOF|nr:ataxin-2 homolog [Asparagus officinalis]ONK75601.1 uncharacterized protein A4U43_C03F18610 [Asparagus officinalis]